MVHPDTGFGGDNDPVDVLEIREKPCIADHPRDHAPWYGRTKPQYLQEEQDQEGFIVDAVEAIVFRSDISKYIINEHSHTVDIDINFKYSYVYFFVIDIFSKYFYVYFSRNIVVTLWLKFINRHWSVEETRNQLRPSLISQSGQHLCRAY